MYRKILLAYNGSVEGRAVLAQGADLAGLCGAAVCLLAVIDMPSAFAGSEIVSADMATDNRRQVEETVREGIRNLRARSLEVEGRVAYGEPVAQIAAVAAEIGADLVVVGHRKRGALARWWAGGTSVSRNLLSRIGCSVLVAVENPANGTSAS
ncbi:MAG TPA: universal stress protein [Gammaproteobacteria bacterium]|nr:universal stress protein [Gammaproteobacteria bacterium]